MNGLRGMKDRSILICHCRQAQCKQVKEKLGAALLDSQGPAKITTDFASFPSAQLSKVRLHHHPTCVYEPLS
jgi:hypothetical protein